ncbi:MAG: hypothetical protein LBJ20_05685 [Candidatus Methanoplasma sp.]|nr:hypothetical protein [Candidatus Methanoplasma sp.]
MENNEKYVIGFLIACVAIVLISTILSTISFFLWVAVFASFAVIISGGVFDIMLRLGKWNWITQTEKFEDGSKLKSVKGSIMFTWGSGFVLTIMCLLIIGFVHGA